MNISRAAACAFVVLAVCSVGVPVEAGCTISTVGVNFGTYDVFAATALASNGTLTLRCGSSDRNIQVHLSTGDSGSYTPRELSGPGGDVLDYNLHLDAAFTHIWGDGHSGTSVYSNNKPGKDVIHLSVYGRIAARQDVGAGSYDDTVVVEVNF
jgi:spore coat protein U-like protein